MQQQSDILKTLGNFMKTRQTLNIKKLYATDNIRHLLLGNPMQQNQTINITKPHATTSAILKHWESYATTSDIKH